MDIFQAVFNFSTLQHMINSSTIVLLAALGCMFTDQAGMMNIGIDGMMVAGAFAAAVGSWLCGSWVMGLVFAIMTGLLFGLFYSVMVVRLKSDEFIIGMTINVFAVALTSYLLSAMFNQTGSFRPETGSVVTVPFLEFMLFGQKVTLSIMVIISWLLVAATWVLLYRTPLGFWLHASGEHPESLRSVGRSPESMKYLGSLLCGTLSSLSGAALALAYSNTFSENMSDGKGYIAVACVIFGRSNPLFIFLATLLFSFIDAAGPRLQLLGTVNATLTKAFPYLGTVLMLLFIAIADRIRKRRAAKAN